MAQQNLRILICVNTLTSVSSFIYSNHISLFTHTIRKFPDAEFFFFSPHRMSIDNARNTAAKLAMGYECTHLMFLDDDVLCPTDAIEKLVKADKDIICGLVYLRGYPFHVMAFKETQNKEESTFNAKLNLTYYDDLPVEEEDIAFENGKLQPRLKELVSCTAIGFSCALIKVDVIQALN